MFLRIVQAVELDYSMKHIFLPQNKYEESNEGPNEIPNDDLNKTL